MQNNILNKFIIKNTKNKAAIPTNTAATVVTVATPIISAIAVAKNVPIIPINTHLPFEHMHLEILLHPFSLFAAINVATNTANATADVAIAIIKKAKVLGINPKENTTPTIIPIIILIIKVEISHPIPQKFLHPQCLINTPPFIIFMNVILKNNIHLIYYIFEFNFLCHLVIGDGAKK